MKIIVCIVLLCAVALSAAPAVASEVQVIANPSVSGNLTAADLKDVFLGTKSSANGATVESVVGSGAAHEAFLKAYIGKSDQAFRNHLKSLVFTGKGSMPKSFTSDAEVVKYVAATKGAIGYISPSADAPGVRKLDIK
jgi:ABC-type phosphate transport system substrate-binding protein